MPRLNKELGYTQHSELQACKLCARLYSAYCRLSFEGQQISRPMQIAQFAKPGGCWVLCRADDTRADSPQYNQTHQPGIWRSVMTNPAKHLAEDSLCASKQAFQEILNANQAKAKLKACTTWQEVVIGIPRNTIAVSTR